jgi:hypothetical protein
VGFISFCCQIAMITRVWKAQCLPRPSWAQVVIVPHKSNTGPAAECQDITPHEPLPSCVIVFLCSGNGNKVISPISSLCYMFFTPLTLFEFQ